MINYWSDIAENALNLLDFESKLKSSPELCLERHFTVLLGEGEFNLLVSGLFFGLWIFCGFILIWFRIGFYLACFFLVIPPQNSTFLILHRIYHQSYSLHSYNDKFFTVPSIFSSSRYPYLFSCSKMVFLSWIENDSFWVYFFSLIYFTFLYFFLDFFFLGSEYSSGFMVEKLSFSVDIWSKIY